MRSPTEGQAAAQRGVDLRCAARACVGATCKLGEGGMRGGEEESVIRIIEHLLALQLLCKFAGEVAASEVDHVYRPLSVNG